ncbi:hypothetical protein AGDE_12867 [Angomonas deanei]|uniref:Uncharacterized protein n=1 Tax=Angomonas deanei TaxID=59799 RepID=A0A7G2C631_9TRYP|nr:hypothetical protein AGDE_12867 [Angomonas deanei]CAD2213342.1 hypothetical protein, conserved [Angomonas deanei]|eukprot:EPY23362.1 hypothetical protein AGDE_12867 [Angomonas deanei]
MGIDSAFKSVEDVPRLDRHKLLPKLREEGEVTGSLWSLDGGELSYPKDGGGPQGWGVRLWRERALLKKEYQKVLDGQEAPPEFSALGTSTRVAGDQLDIEESGAKTPGELADWRKFENNRYDDGRGKPLNEIAFPVDPSAEYVWQGERRDSLAPYKTDDEIALESDNVFYSQMEGETKTNTKALVEALKNKEENSLEITQRGPNRKSKYDYLEKWREMYRHGTLEAPEEPLLHFGRSPDDHHDTVAASVRDWYATRKRTPVTDEQIERFEKENSRSEESRLSGKANRQSRRSRKQRR